MTGSPTSSQAEFPGDPYCPTPIKVKNPFCGVIFSVTVVTARRLARRPDNDTGAVRV